MTFPDIELVAAAVHESWMESKRAQGITSRKAENGEELMVPYSQLSEPQREMDRVLVRTVYEAQRAVAAGAQVGWDRISEMLSDAIIADLKGKNA